MQNMNIFELLTEIAKCKKAKLPLLKTFLDFELVEAIGLHQQRGKPISVKQLALEGIGTPSTIGRRMAALRNMGYVITSEHPMDGRMLVATLSPGVLKVYKHCSEMIEKRSPNREAMPL